MRGVVCRVGDQTSGPGSVTVARQNGETVLCREPHDRRRLRKEVRLDYHGLVATCIHGCKRIFEHARTANHQRMELEP
jgi:hypothetical protein